MAKEYTADDFYKMTGEPPAPRQLKPVVELYSWSVGREGGWPVAYGTIGQGHPRIRPGKSITTSVIVSQTEDEIETLNTVYKLIKERNDE